MFFIRFPFKSDFKAFDCGKNPANVSLIKRYIKSYLGTDQFTLLCNGKLLHNEDIVPNDSNIQVTFSLPGGKGGFGSMLRAIGAQIEKTTNREACRDLSGRRLRDINEEQRLKKWISKEAEREAEKIRRRKERIERLKTKAPHKFFDFEYEKEISELPDRINDALSEGLQNAKQPPKRPLEKSEKPVKKTWLTDDFHVSSSDSELDDTTDDSPSKKQKLMQSTVSSSCDADISGSSQSLPASSKDNNFTFDENSASCSSKTALIGRKRGASSLPSSSKNRNFIFDDSSSSCDSKTAVTERKRENNSLVSDDSNVQDEQSNSNDTGSLKHVNTSASSVSSSGLSDSAESVVDSSIKEAVLDGKVSQLQGSEIGSETTAATEAEENLNKDGTVQSKPDGSSSKKDSEEKDDSPIDLLDFQDVSELEELGLDKLKSALLARGLKCGGTLSDRAERLWKIRGLQAHEYPANLLAKKKK